MSKVRKRLILTILVLIGLVAVASGFAYGYLNNYVPAPGNQIVDGVKIGSVDVGGVKPEEALSQVEASTTGALLQPVNLIYGSRTWKVNLKDLGIGLDLEGTIDEAVGVGHQGSLWKRYQESYAVKKEGRQIDLYYKIDEARTAAIISELTQELNTSPIDASFIINNRGEIVITADKPGSRVNSEAVVQELQSILANGVKEPLDKILNISLNIVDEWPQVTGKDLHNRKINGLLATYTTQFKASNINRTYNVKVAAEALNHQQIEPGETFSFNKVVGPRSQEAGYKEALIILQNEFVPGLGGGVCQVSSTLYNAVLLADLAVVERSNHSLPVDYVPPGLDATVAYGLLDLRFTNTTEGYLLLQSKVKGNNLTIQIFGDKDFRKDIELSSRVVARTEPEVIKKLNPDLYEGEESVEQAGKAGLRVQVYRVLKEQGKILQEKLVSTDIYKPLNKIVQVGTKQNNLDPSDQSVEQPSKPVPVPIPADGEEELPDHSSQMPETKPETNNGNNSEQTPATNSQLPNSF